MKIDDYAKEEEDTVTIQETAEVMDDTKVYDALCKRIRDLKAENKQMMEQMSQNDEEIRLQELELEMRILKGHKGKMWVAESRVKRRAIGKVTDAEVDQLMKISPSLIRENDSVITIKINNPYMAKDVNDELDKRGYHPKLKVGTRGPKTLSEIDRESKTNHTILENYSEIQKLLMIKETKEIIISPTILNAEADVVEE